MPNSDMNWEYLSLEVARETGCDPNNGFSQDGQHPWIVAAIRIATLKERKACVEMCINEANMQWREFEESPSDYIEGRADSADYLSQKMCSPLKST